MTFDKMKLICDQKYLEVETDAALHMVISAFLEGESKILSETCEMNNARTVSTHKSGLELWRLLNYSFDRASSFNVIGLLEFIRNMTPAKHMQDVMPKISALERVHQEYYKLALASKDPDFVKMKSAGVSVYPEVFKKADLLKVLPDGIVKELRKSTNIDFEKHSYSELRDKVTTIVHNHMNTTAPMDIDKINVMAVEGEEKVPEEVDGEKERHEEEKAEEPWCLYNEYCSVIAYMGKGGGQKGGDKGKGKGKHQRVCYNCGKTGHMARDCWAKGGKGNKGDFGKGGYGKGDGHKGKGKGLNSFDTGAFAPQPQPIQQQQPQYPVQNPLMPVNSWGGYYGGNGFGCLNLSSLTPKEAEGIVCQPCRPYKPEVKNKFSALEVTEANDVEVTGPTIGDALNKAFESMGAKKPKAQKKKKKKVRFEDESKADVLMCLLTASNQVEQNLCAHNNLAQGAEEEYEQISVMVDSGASETVASEEKFEAYELIATTAVGTQYSAAAESGAAIVNKGEKLIDVVDANGVATKARFQICSGLSQSKILGSVSRLVQAGHTVVFRNPQKGSYIQNDANGYKNFLRQENGSYYLDLWVRKAPVSTGPGKW